MPGETPDNQPLQGAAVPAQHNTLRQYHEYLGNLTQDVAANQTIGAATGTQTGRWNPAPTIRRIPVQNYGRLEEGTNYTDEPQEYFYNDELELDRPQDTYALNDETPINDWRIQEYKNEKNKVKEVTIDKETFKVIEEITCEISSENLNILQNIYKTRLDILGKLDHNSLIDSYSNDEENIAYQIYSNTILSFALLANENVIGNGTIGTYLGRIEDRAKARYHIDYSKYKYYPRLKSTVKYGNPELLSKIMLVTQIGKGKVICK